jgi:hypothetical protein
MKYFSGLLEIPQDRNQDKKKLNFMKKFNFIDFDILLVFRFTNSDRKRHRGNEGKKFDVRALCDLGFFAAKKYFNRRSRCRDRAR